jgi:hypothetical protein
MPVDPPPCVDGSAPPEAKPVGTGMHADRGDTGQLLVTPTTIVAPVGGEVVILAAICGKDGFFVTKEPIEWMLSPDSVGTFLEVGDEWKGKPLHQWNASTRVEKVDHPRQSQEHGRSFPEKGSDLAERHKPQRGSQSDYGAGPR